MADVNSNIGINFDTTAALASLRKLQAGLSTFHQSLTQGNVAAMNAQKGLNSQLIQAINATGKFVASQKEIATSTGSFTQALEKNQLSMRQYFRYTAAAATANTKTFKGMFAQEREIINRARKDRVKLLQSQYIQLGNANGDLVKVLQVIPKHLQMANGKYTDYATRVQMAAQRQQFLNQLLKQGSTNLLNFGKNTQWAGRQLMVGLTIPLSILGSAAAKTFMEMEQAVTKFSRVYGDMFTGGDATNKAVAEIQRLGKEFTKYGIAVKDTVEMAASAAAMGLTGSDLNSQVIQATRLAVLGQVEQQQALETTISLTNAFGVASEDLAQKINYLNAVENQTVLSIEDFTIAVPKAGPVVKQLGGSVEDLAFFMTAMKEGGINASEGANALKSGLASMINPSKKSSEFLAELGINIKGLVEANKGDLKGTVVGFARALDELDPLNRARAIEQLFGKFQFARLSTLFQNVTKDSSQAARALGLAGASVEELAILSERELGKVEDMTGNKFKKAMENIKLQLVPVGKAFLQAATPIVNFVGKILEKFNGLSDGTKKVIAIMVGVLGAVAPVALMTFGVLVNGIANVIKFFAMLRGGIAKLNGQNNVLGGGFDYLTNQQTELLAETNALHTSHQQLLSTFNVEKTAVDALALAYGNAASQARALAQSSPGLFNSVPGPAGAVAGLPKYAKGKKSDVVTVGGTGNQDSELALLTPGETVISAPMSAKYGTLINAMIDDKVAGYAKSKPTPEWLLKQSQTVRPDGTPLIKQPTSGAIVGGPTPDARLSLDAMAAPGNSASGPGMNLRWLADTEEAKASILNSLKVGQMQAEGLDVRGSYDQFWSHLDDPIKELAAIFQNEAQPLADRFDELNRIMDRSAAVISSPTATKEEKSAARSESNAAQMEKNQIKVSDAGERAYPKVVEHIDALERESRLTAEEAGKLRVRTRSLLAPTDEDRIAYAPARYDLAIDPETGGEVVKRPGADGRITPEGTREYNRDQVMDTYPLELARQGLPVPENIDEFQYAHVGKRVVTGTRNDEVSHRDYRDATGPTPGESFVARELAAGRTPKTGDQVSTKEELQAWAREKINLEEQNDLANAVDSQITKAREEAKAASPSERTRELGKDIADGLKVGMQDGQPGVKAQSDQLVEAAMPSAAETQAKVDKMDLGNKAFYDDIDTPEMRDERQVLKSLDRQRRKRGAGGTVGVESDASSSTSIVSVSAETRTRTQAAADQVAIKTEQAATAQSQVVQQIKDESKTRVKIKGNTINIGQARDEAEKAEKESADARKKAASLEAEQAKQIKSKSPTTITDEQVLAAKEKANALELEAAKKRQTAAMAELEGKNTVVSDEDVKDIGKVKKIQEKNNELVSNGTQEQGDGLKRIVEGTDETAGSTLLVADQTDELAGVTGDAVNAQTSNVDNLITTGQLTDAANNNLGEMIPAMDQTGVAQQDLATSSANIAVVNDDIEAEKREQLERLKKYNAQEAARQAAENGIVPPGSQSGNEELGKNRMGSVEAYEEASTYTRDKNGQIIFDPELDADGKKQPTTLSAKQVKEKKRGMRREKVGKFSGKISGAAGTAAMVAGMAGAPPQVTAALGGVATVAQFAPMLAGMTGPQGIVVALAAVAAGAYLFNKHLNAMAGKAAQFAKDLSATRDGLKAIGEVSGKVGSSQIMDKRRERSQYTKYTDEVKIDDTFGKGFLGTAPGKKEKELFQQNIKDFGKDKAIADLGLKLSTAVADGVLDSGQADSIAANLAIAMKDQSIELQVIGQMRSLIGPDGEDLKKDPMKTRIKIMAKAQGRTEQLEKDIAKKSGFGESSRKEVAALAALNMNNLELQTMMADQVQVEYETAKKKLETEIASTTNAQKKLELENKLSTLNSENAKNSQFMNDQIFGQIIRNQMSFDKVYSDSVWGKQAMREDAYFDASKAQVTSTYKGTDQEDAAKSFLNKTQALGNDTTYGKYNEKTGQYVKTGLDGQKGAQRFQAKMEMLVGSKVLSPGQATSYMDLFSGKLNEMDFLLNAGIKTKGTSKTKELFDTFAGFGTTKGRNKATAIITEMIVRKKDPAEYDAIMETLKQMQSMNGNTIDFEILVTSVGLDGVERIKKQQAEIQKIREAAEKDKKESLVGEDNKIDPQIAAIDANMAAAATSLEGNRQRMAEFKKLSVAEQAQYLQALATQIEYEGTLTDAQRTEEIRVLAIQEATNQALLEGYSTSSQYYDNLLTAKIAELTKLSNSDIGVRKLSPSAYDGIDSKKGPAVPPGGGGTKDNPLDFLDALAMRIKNVRDGAFDATKPLKSMLAAFSNPKVKKDMALAFNMFDGLQQRMIGMKVPKEFRDMISGMSSEDFKKLADLKKEEAIFNFKKDKNGKALPKTKANIESLTDTGKKLMKTYNEAIVGEAQVVNLEAVEQVQNQEKAFKMLVAGGATATEALEHVQDAATAAAIASGALGKAGSPERKKYIEDLKKATDETERFALSQKMITANEEFKLLEQMPKLATSMRIAGFTADQMSEVLNDPALAKSLIEDLKDGKIEAGEIADYLNSIEARKIIDIQTNFNSGKFSESAQPGMEIVDEMFAVQESLLRTGADPRTTDMVKTLQANEDKLIDLELAAKPFRREIELINREIRDIEQGIEKNYTRPIEELQEKISDQERELEINSLFGDRAMEDINKRNAKLSNDSAIMANQAEKINEEYDKQAEALAKVAAINEDILNQQKGQLDIAGALTSGDIAAAARAAQEQRAQSAQRFSGSLSEALDQSRSNEINNLRGKETGKTQKEIDQEQFENAQKLYEMENNPARVAILEDIRKKQDEIYRLEELREAELLKIQVKEDAILKIQKDQLQPLEDKIADITYANELIQAEIDKLVKGTKVLGQTQQEWDKVKAKIEANTLASKDFDVQLGKLLASTEAIDKKWQSILDKLAKYNGTPQGVLDAKKETQAQAQASLALTSAQKELADAEKALQDAINKGQWASFEALTKKVNAAKAKVKDATTAKESADKAAGLTGGNTGVGGNTGGTTTGGTTTGGTTTGGTTTGGTTTGGTTTGGTTTGGTTTGKQLKQTAAQAAASKISNDMTILAQARAAQEAYEQKQIDKMLAAGLPDPRKGNSGDYRLDLNAQQRDKLDELRLTDEYQKIQKKYKTAQDAAERSAEHPLLNSQERPDARHLEDSNFMYFYSWIGGITTGSWVLYRVSKTKENIDKYGSRPFGGKTQSGTDTAVGANGLEYQPQPIKDAKGNIIGYEIPDYSQFDSYSSPEDTEESVAALDDFIGIVKKVDAAQEALDAAEGSASTEEYNRLVKQLADAQAAYDATLPKIDPSDVGGGGGGRYGMQMLASGGMVNPMRFAMGGFARGTDTVPAMLTPGEFIMSKYAVDAHGINTMKSINSGQPTGGAVYNNTYALTVNARTDANPNDIAQAVMSTIRQVDDRRIRGVSING